MTFVHISYSQRLKKVTPSNEEVGRGVICKFVKVEDHFQNVNLILYNNYKYEYRTSGPSFEDYSEGKWANSDNDFILNSTIDSTDIPIRILFDTPLDTIRWRNITKIQVPKDINGERLGDAQIFVNSMDVHYFPFFDTCIGNCQNLDSIKFDFGRGLRSRWYPVLKKDFNQLLVIADVKHLASIKYLGKKELKF